MARDRPETTQLNKSELIESIYRIALEPQTYDEFMGHWEDFIQGQIDRLNDLQIGAEGAQAPQPDSEIEKHFSIALRLLEQAGRPDTQEGDPKHRTRVPQMMFSQDGMVVWHNSAARKAFDLGPGRTLADFHLSDQHRAQLLDLLNARTAARVVLVRMGASDSDRMLPMSFELSNASANELLFMATEVRQRWPKSTDMLLEDGFGLSAAEIDICSLIVEGHSTAEISEVRKSAVGTVRTQIKKILQKTGSATQVDLVGLLHATMRLAETEEPPQQPDARIPNRVINLTVGGRAMPVESFGDPGGVPVIFFHGMLDGNAMTRNMREALSEAGFHMICPLRPHYGAAPPDMRGGNDRAPERFARDVEEMVAQLRITQPILMGHMAGSLYAFAAAARPEINARGIVNIAGGVPIVSASQFATMSVRQRVVACTARYTPRVLPFVIRAGINQLDNRGEWQFMQSLYENTPCDLRVAADPEVREILFAGYHSSIVQGHRAFEIDSYHVVRDWSADVARSTAPIELVHGAKDPVVSLISVQSFAQRLGPRARVTVLEDCGQLLLYTQADTVVAALRRMCDQSDGQSPKSL